MSAKVTRLPTAAKRRVKNGVALLDGSEPNVVSSGVLTRLDLPVERILAQAGLAKLTQVAVVGFDADGDFYFAGSQADGGDALWLLEIAKKRLVEIGDA